MGKPATTTTKPNGHTKPVAEPAEDQHLAPAVVPTSLPSAFEADFDEYAGAGTSDRPEDVLTPFLAILQKGSPQVNARDPAYIEGAKPGMLLNTATSQLYDVETEYLHFIQAFSKTCEVQWIPRSRGGGFVASHELNTPLVLQVKETINPSNPDGPRLRMLPDGTQLVTTAYHFGYLLDTAEPVVIGLSSSGLAVHRATNTLLRNKKVFRNGVMKVMPAFNSILLLGSVWKSNQLGDWYNWKIVDGGFINPDDPQQLAVREDAKALFMRSVNGEIKVSAPPSDSTSSNSAEIPSRMMDTSPHADDDSIPY